MDNQFLDKLDSIFAGCNLTEDQLSTLKACINGDIDPGDAARRLTTYPVSALTPLEMQQRIAGLWTLLNDTAVGVPAAQPTIISILRTIKTFPKVDEPTGEGEGIINLDDGHIWSELTDWANDWADNYNRMEL